MKPRHRTEIKEGRPSKYSKNCIKAVEEYLKWCVEENQCPFVEELALKFGCSDKTVWEWSKTYSEFRDVYQKLITYQKLDLKRKSLNGKYVNKIAAILLSSEHNVVEKQRREVSGVNGETIKVENNYTAEQEDFMRCEIAKAVEKMTKMTQIPVPEPFAMNS